MHLFSKQNSPGHCFFTTKQSFFFGGGGKVTSGWMEWSTFQGLYMVCKYIQIYQINVHPVNIKRFFKKKQRYKHIVHHPVQFSMLEWKWRLEMDNQTIHEYESDSKSVV